MLRARKNRGISAETTAPVGGFSLALRGLALSGLPWIHGVGVGVGSLMMMGLGGVIPVARGWINNEINDRSELVARLGGLRVTLAEADRAWNFGPILKRSEAPLFFDTLEAIARQLGARPPDEVRLAFLPCCGVVAHHHKRVLLVGLPLLQVLNRREFQAILAHEMAHLARGDATRVMDGLRFVEALGMALENPEGRSWGLLRGWGWICHRVGVAIATPVARGQEARADRVSALIAGGGVAATALAKVALVQPLFREVLGRFHVDRPDRPNVFATFRVFWGRLPAPLLDEMRLRLQVDQISPSDDPHPPLADRLATIQRFPDRTETFSEGQPASSLVNDSEWLEEMLHEALFRRIEIRPSVFHRAGS